MKKSLFLIPLAAFAMASCSDDNGSPVEMPQVPSDKDGNIFISFGLSNTPSIGTKAGDSDYENGEDLESKVNNVRFLFYDANGNTVAVKKNGSETVASNWYDYNPTAAGSDGESAGSGTNVEKIINATIVLNTRDFADQTVYPAKVAVLINPVGDMGKNVNLSALRASISSNVSDPNNFLMSSSVFHKDGTLFDAIDLNNQFYTSETEAKENALSLYVERVAAKVRVNVDATSIDLPNGLKAYKTGESFNGDVYVSFFGWNVTTVTNETNLLKNINPAWNLNWTGWNIPDLYRSFWALNPSALTYSYTSFTQGDYEKANAVSIGGSTYLRENASNDATTGADPERCSQIILAGQLVKEDGTPIKLAEYLLVKYDLDQVNMNSLLYSKLGKEIYKNGAKIDPTKDIVFKTSTAVNKNTKDANDAVHIKGTGTYNVYAQLNGSGYSYEGSSADDTAAINQELLNLGEVKIWNNGYTYYFLDIAHLNPSGTVGKVGVVRNHLYDINVNNVQGLGTPVYDFGEEIIPERPKSNYGVLAAQVNILSWRVVPQDATLNGKPLN